MAPCDPCGRCGPCAPRSLVIHVQCAPAGFSNTGGEQLADTVLFLYRLAYTADDEKLNLCCRNIQFRETIAAIFFPSLAISVPIFTVLLFLGFFRDDDIFTWLGRKKSLLG